MSKFCVMLYHLTCKMFILVKVECSNPSLLPEPGKRRSVEEPFVKVLLYALMFIVSCYDI